MILSLEFSCKHNTDGTPTPTNTINMTSADDHFIFLSRDAYDSLLNDPVKLSALNNNSTFRGVSNYYDSTDEMSSALCSILNKDGIVQIGQWICKVDFPAGYVYVLDAKNRAKSYTDLLNKNIRNPNILQFSVEDEVLTMLEDSTQSNSFQLRKGCHDRHAHKNKAIRQGKDLAYTGSDGNSYSAKIKHSYEKAGIYFSLESKIKNERWDGLLWNLNQNGQTQLFLIYDFEVRCNGNSAYNHVGAYIGDNDNGYNELSDENSRKGIVEHRVYSGSRALKQYYLSTLGMYRDDDQQSNGGPMPQFQLDDIQDY